MRIAIGTFLLAAVFDLIYLALTVGILGFLMVIRAEYLKGGGEDS